MQKQATAFEEFQALSEDPQKESQLADINNEIRWLWHIKDVFDELIIMANLFESQKRGFQVLDNVVR
jgi:hypothetical protein